MKKILGIFLVIILTACGCANDKKMKVSTKAEVKSDWMGTWIRQATYVDGAVVSTTPATLVLKKASYTSTSKDCANSGDLRVTPADKTMTMNMTKNSCPGLQVPFLISNLYTITDNGKTMTIEVANMKEIYKKSN